MRDLRHVCDVMRPATAKDSRGQQSGNPTVLVRDWPCAITPTGGSEVEQFGSTFSDAGFEVAGFGDPEKPFRAKDYLILKDGSGRRFDISHISDAAQNGLELILTCSEQVGEKL